jgi:hypothetical protein
MSTGVAAGAALDDGHRSYGKRRPAPGAGGV